MKNDAIAKLLAEKKNIYGENSISLIAKYWSMFTSQSLGHSDVCQMMIMMKLARLRHALASGKKQGINDTIDDIQGYAELLRFGVLGDEE